MTIQAGSIVSLQYTVRLNDEEVYDTNVDAEPLVYTHGTQQLIPGLERALEGMDVGQSKRVTIHPADGYGEVHAEGRFEVDKARVPAAALTIGTRLEGKAPDGTPVFPRVAEIKDATVVLDLNHPLAGKILYFDVTVLGVQPPRHARADGVPM